MIDAIIFFVGTLWIGLNIFFLPFFPWTEGLFRGWLLTRGLAPYRDFLWNRGVVDIGILALVENITGVTQIGYQLIIFLLFVLIGWFLFTGLKKLDSWLSRVSYILYIIFLFPLFSNAEMEEVLVALFALVGFLSLWKWLRSGKYRFLLTAGVAAGISYLTKQTSAVVMPVSLVFILFRRKEIVRNMVWYGAGVLIPLIGFASYLMKLGIVRDYVVSLLFVAQNYAGWAKAWGIEDGIRMTAIFLSAVIPFVFFIDKSQADAEKLLIEKNVRYLLAGLILSLFVMLLPSYWSYRLVASFPLLCIAMAVVARGVKKWIVVASAVVFVGFFVPFGRAYVQGIKDNGFSFGQYLLDYGEEELQAAAWLRDHTDPQTRVFSIANNIILVRAGRLPFNRYVGGMPIDFLPFDKTAAEMSQNPPRVVVIDRGVLEDWPELSNWKFIDFLQKNYTLQQEFGTIAIYSL